MLSRLEDPPNAIIDMKIDKIGIIQSAPSVTLVTYSEKKTDRLSNIGTTIRVPKKAPILPVKGRFSVTFQIMLKALSMDCNSE